MASKRNIFILILLVLVGSGVVAAMIWLPKSAKTHATQYLSDRGVHFESDATSMFWGGVEFSKVRANGRGVNFQSPALRIELDLAASILSLGPVIERVRIAGGDIELDLDAEKKPRGEASQRKKARRISNIEVEDVSVKIKDRHGLLLSANVSIGANENIVLRMTNLLLGAAPSERLEMKKVLAEARRGGRGDALLHSLVAESSALHFGDEKGVRLQPRVRAAFKAILGKRNDEENTVSSGSSAESNASNDASWLTRYLHPAAQLQLRSFRVSMPSGEGERTIVDGVSLSLNAGQNGKVEIDSSGKTPAGGNFSVELEAPFKNPGLLNGQLRFREMPFALIANFLPAIPWHAADRAKLSGDLELKTQDDVVDWSGNVELSQAAIASERVASIPIFLGDLSIEGSGKLLPSKREISFERAVFQNGAAKIIGSGWARYQNPDYAAQLDFVMPKTTCSAALGMIPADFLSEIQGFSLDGDFGAGVKVDIDSSKLDETVWDMNFANNCRFAAVPAMADVRRFASPFLHKVRDEDDDFSMMTGPGTGHWTRIEDISPFLIHAVLAHEDAGFFRHAGFSKKSMRDALVKNLKAGRYVRGASTISMQLTKNLFLRREKTLARKIQEVILTWWLEHALEKKKMLELYLNIIEYGPKIYGIRSASRHYFNADPSELTPAQSAYLALILPAPKRYQASFEKGGLTQKMQRKMGRFLNHLASKGRIDAAALAGAQKEVAGFTFRSGSLRYPGKSKALPFQVGEEELAEFEAESKYDDENEGGAEGGNEAVDDIEEERIPALDDLTS